MTNEVSRTEQRTGGPLGADGCRARSNSPMALPSARLLDLRPVSAAPIACTLTGDEQTARVHEWRDLLADTRPVGIANGLRWLLPNARAGQAAELAAAEQRCCAFFDFTLHLTAGELVLEAHAPEEAAELFLEVFGAPAGDPAPAGDVDR